MALMQSRSCVARSLTAMAGLLAMSLLGSVPAHAAENAGPELTWRMSLWGSSRPFTAGAEKLSALLLEQTQGRWKLELHYHSELSKPYANLNDITNGRFEAALDCSFFHPSRTPALTALSLPFLPITSWKLNRKIREAVYEVPTVRKDYEGRGARLYVSTFLPQYELIGKGRPIRTEADWNGVSIRAGGGVARAAKVLRAMPSTPTPSEIYADLRSGAISAAALPATYGPIAYRLHEVAEWFTSNLAPGSADCPLIFSTKAYEALPSRYKALLDDVRNTVIDAQIAAYLAADAKNLVTLRSRLKEITFTPAERARFFEAAGRPVIEDWIRKHQPEFDARGLIRTIFRAAGTSYDD